MYCYSRMRVDGKLYANLEHAQPADSFHTYSDEERKIIDTHIKRFRLNDPKYRTRQLYDFIKNIIDNSGKIPRYEYNNLIIELFSEQ